MARTVLLLALFLMIVLPPVVAIAYVGLDVRVAQLSASPFSLMLLMGATLISSIAAYAMIRISTKMPTADSGAKCR